MDIICARCGRHLYSIESVKEHAKYCKGSPNIENNQVSSKNIQGKAISQIKVVFPPPIPAPKHSNPSKPFLGAYKDKELINDDDRTCGLCNNRGLVAHALKSKKITIIDMYWCPNCKMALWENQTNV